MRRSKIECPIRMLSWEQVLLAKIQEMAEGIKWKDFL